MSNQINTTAILEGIREAIIAAWTTMNSVDYGKPRTLRPVAPYAVIYPDSVAISIGGRAGTVLNTNQENHFTIVGRWPFPTDSTAVIELQKIDQANAAIAQLQASANFAGGGMYPIVTGVDFTEPDNLNEQVYEITVTFSVLTQASHH